MPKRRFGDCLPSRLMPSGAGSRAVRRRRGRGPGQRANRLLGRSNKVSFRVMTRRRIRPQDRGVNANPHRLPTRRSARSFDTLVSDCP